MDMTTPGPCACLQVGCQRCDGDGRISHWARGYSGGLTAASENVLRILDQFGDDPAFAVAQPRSQAEATIRFATGSAGG